METPSVVCEDEIDLRELALTLWRGKWVILLVTVGLAALALIVSLSLPKQYQTEASLVLTQPRVKIGTQGGIDFVVSKADIETARALAQSTGVFQALASDADIQAAWQGEDEPLAWDDLAEKAKVSEVGKQTLRLTYKDVDPQRAALVVNHWAEEVAGRINAEYGFDVVLNQISAEVEAAQQIYQEAEAAYIQALTKDRRTALEKQIKRLESDLGCVLARQSDIGRLQGDLQAFDDYLKKLPADETLTPGDAMALTMLQQRVLATKVCMTDTPSLQTQWQTADLTALTVAKAAAFIEKVQTVLRQRESDLAAQQTTLEERIVQLRQELEQEEARMQEVVQQRDVAWEAYQSLSEAQAHGRALIMEGNDVAMIASQAVPPRKPSSPRVMMNTALAGVLGLVLSSLVVLVWSWWQEDIPAES